MIELDDAELRNWFGFGVAGNFAGHLEQAGEAADFVNVKSEGPAPPKGIFPWYAPGYDGFLGEFPLSHDTIVLPASETPPLNLQIEPEVGLACEVRWQGDTVTSLVPFALGAFNDCSIRRPNAPKISHKKNWGGPASKGVAREFFDISDLTPPDGPTATLRLVCYLNTADGQEHEYGGGQPAAGLFLLRRSAAGLDHRTAGQPEGFAGHPTGGRRRLMVASGHPDRVLIGIGATRYTALGESTFLKPGDEAVVRVYDTTSDEFSELRQKVSGSS